MKAQVVTDTADIIGRIDRNIYGHFIEHLGRCIYGGIWAGQEAKIPHLRGFRKDVLDAVKRLRPPIIRWPGGNFASGYHFEDGLGPREARPKKFDLAWRKPEPNEFGTDEFIDFCREVGTEPYICVNTGSAPPEEAANWVEYCNSEGDTKYAAMRAKNGHPEPFAVKYWGIGNEVYGSWQIGAVDAKTYALQAREFAKQMRRVDPEIKLVAVGCGDPEWNREVLKMPRSQFDYIALHKYYRMTEYYDIVASSLEAELSLQELAGLINAIPEAKERGVKISFDEWNVARREGHHSPMIMRLQDGLFACGTFNAMHRLCNWVTMANLAQLVNVLPAIVTDETRLYVNPIYLAFLLYGEHTGKVALKTRVEVETYTARVGQRELPQVPYLDSSFTLDEEAKKLYLAAINRHKDDSIEAEIVIRDAEVKPKVKIYELNGPETGAANDFGSPDVVKITEKSMEGAKAKFTYPFPAHSASIIEFELE